MQDIPDQLKGLELGGCRLLHRLGAGGMGVVYKGHHTRLDRPVAVKVLSPKYCENPDLVAEFQREAKSAARLEHPRIVQVYDAGTQGEVNYIVMQFIDGETLLERLERVKSLPPMEALQTIKAVMEALREAHGHGMVHRDVKPGNVLLGKDGSIRLSDFGLAAPVAELSKPGTDKVVAGTPDYMSPEQTWGAPLDARSDIYSAGATFFHILAGTPPFDGASGADIAASHLNEPVPDIRARNPEATGIMSKVISRMMAKRPEDRYASADEVLAELNNPGMVMSEMDAMGNVPVLMDIKVKPKHATSRWWTSDVRTPGPGAEPFEAPVDGPPPGPVFQSPPRSRLRAAGAAALLLGAGTAFYLGGAASAAWLLLAIVLAGSSVPLVRLWPGLIPISLASIGAVALLAAGRLKVPPEALLGPERPLLMLILGLSLTKSLINLAAQPEERSAADGLLALAAAAGMAACLYLLALPPETPWNAPFLGPHKDGALLLAQICAVSVVLAPAIGYFGSGKASGIILPLPLSAAAALTAYGAGALENRHPPPPPPPVELRGYLTPVPTPPGELPPTAQRPLIPEVASVSEVKPDVIRERLLDRYRVTTEQKFWYALRTPLDRLLRLPSLDALLPVGAALYLMGLFGICGRRWDFRPRLVAED